MTCMAYEGIFFCFRSMWSTQNALPSSYLPRHRSANESFVQPTYSDISHRADQSNLVGSVFKEHKLLWSYALNIIFMPDIIFDLVKAL